MSFYSSLAATAAKLIKDKGQPLTLGLVAVGDYNADTGIAPTTPTEQGCFGVVLDFPAKEINNTTILSKDKKVVLSVEGLTRDPETFESLLIGSVKHEIITCKPLAPAGTAVIYTLQVRKGG